MGSNELGEALRALRRRLGLSRLALSDEADVSATYIAQIEGGVDPRTGKPFQPSPGVLRRLALALARNEPGEGQTIYARLMAAAGYLPHEVEEIPGATLARDVALENVSPASLEPLARFRFDAEASEAPGAGIAGVLPARSGVERGDADLPLRAEVARVLGRWNDLSPGERAALYAVARLIGARHPWSAAGPDGPAGPDDQE